jgi:hypothetical protein
LEIIKADIHVTGQLIARFFFPDSGEKVGYCETVHNLFMDYKLAFDSIRREVLYNILIGFEVPIKLITQVKMCLS